MAAIKILRTMQPSTARGHNRDRSPVRNPVNQLLMPEASTKLCGRLLTELGTLGSSEDAATVGATVSAREEQTDQSRRAARRGGFSIETAQSCDGPADAIDGPAETPKTTKRRALRQKARSASEQKPSNQSVDKSVLALSEPRRIRDHDHVRYVAKQACLICGRRPCDAHHLRFAKAGPSDARSAMSYGPAVPGPPSRGPSLRR